MAHSVYLDPAADAMGSPVYRVTWFQGMQPARSKDFVTRAEAEAFAMSKMNKRNGMLLSTLDMTAEQRAEHEARQARLRNL